MLVREIFAQGVNKFSYFLYLHAINVLLYRMKPRKHIYRYVKYCWQTYFKSIGTLSQIFKNHIVTVAFKWCVPSASDVCLSKNDNSGRKTREDSEVVEYDFYFKEYDFSPVWSRVLISPLYNQINLFMVINIWGIIIYYINIGFFFLFSLWNIIFNWFVDRKRGFFLFLIKQKKWCGHLMK